MFCNQCGTEIINNAKFCTSCGPSAVIISEPVEGSKIKSLKIKDPFDMTPIITLSAINKKEFNKYFFALFFGLNFLNIFEVMLINNDADYTLVQSAFIGIIVSTFFNILFVLAYFLKKKSIGAFFAGLNFALYLGISVWDFYDRFIVGDESITRNEGMLTIAMIVISYKLFDLVRKYPSLIAKA